MNIILEVATIVPFEYEHIVEKIIRQSLLHEHLHQNVEVSVTIVDLEEIRQINAQHRKIDRPTDVLSFPMIEPEDVAEAFKEQQIPVLLGDIVLCMEKATEQATTYGHGIEREVAFLVAHSMLHLLGYDHEIEEEEKEMFEKQEEILREANYTR